MPRCELQPLLYATEVSAGQGGAFHSGGQHCRWLLQGRRDGQGEQQVAALHRCAAGGRQHRQFIIVDGAQANQGGRATEGRPYWLGQRQVQGFILFKHQVIQHRHSDGKRSDPGQEGQGASGQRLVVLASFGCCRADAVADGIAQPHQAGRGRLQRHHKHHIAACFGGVGRGDLQHRR